MSREDDEPKNEEPIGDEDTESRPPRRDLWIRLTEEDYATLKAAANLAELTLLDYVSNLIEARARALRSEPDSPWPN